MLVFDEPYILGSGEVQDLQRAYLMAVKQSIPIQHMNVWRALMSLRVVQSCPDRTFFLPQYHFCMEVFNA